jgi:hypothetical protein
MEKVIAFIKTIFQSEAKDTSNLRAGEQGDSSRLFSVMIRM